MITQFRLIVLGIAAAAILGAGIYGRAVYRKAQRVPELEQQVADANEAIAEAYKEIERNGKRTLASLELQHDLTQQRDAARASSGAIADRLRRFYADQALSAAQAAASPPGASPAVESRDSVAEADAVVGEFITACKLDAIDRIGWIKWYELVPNALK